MKNIQQDDFLVCPECGYRGHQWTSYFCKRCGQHFDALFLREHPKPEEVRNWNRADIIQEYHDNGMAFAPPREIVSSLLKESYA